MAALPSLLVFWAVFGLALMSPGPNFAVILGTATRAGRAEAMRTALGMVAGEAVWGFGAVFGLAVLAIAHPWLTTALRIGGGGFLFYLGVQSLRAAIRPPAPPASRAMLPPAASMARGFGLMLLNPKAGVFWVSLTGLLIGPGMPAATAAVAVAGAVAMSLAWHMMLALALSAATVAALYRRVRRGLDTVLGVLLATLGLRLLLID